MKQHPRNGVLGCRVLYPDGTFQSSYFRFTHLRELLLLQCLGLRPLVLLGRRLGFRNLNYPSRYWGRVFSTAAEVDAVAGCFFLVRKSVIDEVGLLDEDFFFYGEEEEWCFRIKRAGWSVVHYPFAEIIHFHGGSTDKTSSQSAFASRRARLIVLEKTRGMFSAWVGNVIMTLGMFLRLPVWLIADWIKTARANEKNNPFSKRLELIRFHLAALVRPVWRPAPANGRGTREGVL
jgi:GT2 family glycosyltransferase